MNAISSEDFTRELLESLDNLNIDTLFEIAIEKIVQKRISDKGCSKSKSQKYVLDLAKIQLDLEDE